MSLISTEFMKAHRARWFVYTAPCGDPGRELIPWQSTMRGFWPGFEVKCSCGWRTNTGGGVRRYVKDLLWDHRWTEQSDWEREQEEN